MARPRQPLTTNVVCAHVDIYPTLLDIVGVKVPNQAPLDGVSLVPLLDGKLTERPKPIGFMLWNGKGGFDTTVAKIRVAHPFDRGLDLLVIVARSLRLRIVHGSSPGMKKPRDSRESEAVKIGRGERI